ncbi:hypothetical protein GCM10009606_17520 [Nocardioides aquiterrae]|uniref:Uncharacterized protein n=1 Tax=Nocardioides aquiterrae TaxID=203799 RepID=A0ABN1UC24_9ACTN
MVMAWSSAIGLGLVDLLAEEPAGGAVEAGGDDALVGAVVARHGPSPARATDSAQIGSQAVSRAETMCTGWVSWFDFDRS